jgi:hypothetical protein
MMETTALRTKEQLVATLERASVLPHESVKDQLSYKQMLVLMYNYLDWAVEPDTTEEHALQLLGWARGLRQMAELVGEDWSPPEPEHLSLIGFMARKLQEEYR